jgi:hypothetical protein
MIKEYRNKDKTNAVLYGYSIQHVPHKTYMAWAKVRKITLSTKYIRDFTS